MDGKVGGVAISGWLTKRGDLRKKWKRRFFVLERNGFLKYFNSSLDVSVSSAINMVDLRSISVITTGNTVSCINRLDRLLLLKFFFPFVT
jgi:hypothetical protein